MPACMHSLFGIKFLLFRKWLNLFYPSLKHSSFANKFLVFVYYILFLFFATLTGEENKEEPQLGLCTLSLHYSQTWLRIPCPPCLEPGCEYSCSDIIPLSSPPHLDSCKIPCVPVLVNYLKNKLCNNHPQPKCLKARITYSHSCVWGQMESDRPRPGLYGVAICIWLDLHLLRVSLLFVLTSYPVHVLLWLLQKHRRVGQKHRVSPKVQAQNWYISSSSCTLLSPSNLTPKPSISRAGKLKGLTLE